MASWVGPALVAAIIAALVSVLGWFVTAGLNFRAEQQRRVQRTRDFRIALRAEIRSELDELNAFDLDHDLERVRRLYEERPSYRVFLPRPVATPATDAIAPELFILPEHSIDDVVVYFRERHAVRSMIMEIRDFDIERYGRDQEIRLYSDLRDMRNALKNSARAAIAALEHTT